MPLRFSTVTREGAKPRASARARWLSRVAFTFHPFTNLKRQKLSRWRGLHDPHRRRPSGGTPKRRGSSRAAPPARSAAPELSPVARDFREVSNDGASRIAAPSASPCSPVCSVRPFLRKGANEQRNCSGCSGSSVRANSQHWRGFTVCSVSGLFGREHEHACSGSCSGWITPRSLLLSCPSTSASTASFGPARPARDRPVLACADLLGRPRAASLG
jgi:hypothetical protein